MLKIVQRKPVKSYFPQLYSSLLNGAAYLSSFLILCVVFFYIAEPFNFPSAAHAIVSIFPCIVLIVLIEHFETSKIAQFLLRAVATVVSIFVVLYCFNAYLKLLPRLNDFFAGPFLEIETMLNKYVIALFFLFLSAVIYIYLAVRFVSFVFSKTQIGSNFLRNALVLMIMFGPIIIFSLSQVGPVLNFFYAHSGFFLEFSLLSLHAGYLVQGARQRALKDRASILES